LSPFPLDGPMPDVPLSNSQQGRQKVVMDMARAENLNIRQLYQKVATARGHRVAIGTGSDIADALEEWYRGGAADGFNIMPQTLPAGLHSVSDVVVSEVDVPAGLERLLRCGDHGVAAARLVPHEIRGPHAEGKRRAVAAGKPLRREAC